MDEKTAYKRIADNLTAIYGYAFSRLYDKDNAEELASEIVFEMMNGAKRCRNDEAFWGYAWKIAENTFRRFIRREELAASVAELTDETVGTSAVSPEEAYVQKETENEELYRLRRELSLLKKTHREVCVAYYVDNKSCSQIAKEQNISVEMVKYHLFKTRKLLKEGMGMTRTLGEKSYNPGTFRLGFWGDRNKYGSLFKRKLPGSIVLAAYDSPLTAQALSVELGVAMPYLEEELEILEAAGVLKKTGDSYQTNLVILTDAYEKAFVESTAAEYATVAHSVVDKTAALLPQIRQLSFEGNDFDDNRLLFGILNLVFVNAFQSARALSPHGNPQKLPLGCYGWIFGCDNDCVNHHFNDVITEMWNRDKTAWFSVENYKVIKSAQLLEYSDFDSNAEALCDAILKKEANRDNPELPKLIEQGFVRCENQTLSPNFLVFHKPVYDELCVLLADVIREVAECMIAISDKAERLLQTHVPSHLKNQCGDVAKIHHRMDVGAFLLENLITDGKLTVPDNETPLCIWGVRI